MFDKKADASWDSLTFTVLTAALVETDPLMLKYIRHLRMVTLPNIAEQRYWRFLRDFRHIHVFDENGNVDLTASMLRNWPNLKTCGIREVESCFRPSPTAQEPIYCLVCRGWHHMHEAHQAKPGLHLPSSGFSSHWADYSDHDHPVSPREYMKS